jgi:hypothetical protein
MTIIKGTNPIELSRLKDNNLLQPLWASNNTLYNSVGEISGKINKSSNKIKIFTISA